MKITLVIPIERYDRLLENCAAERSEYRLLQNCSITQNERGRSAEILCEVEEAENLLLLARQIERELGATEA